MRTLLLASKLLGGSVRSDSVYVVDDDGPFRDSLLALLRTFDQEARGFSSAGEFLAAVETLEPGVVFLDLRIGRADGRDILKALDNEHCQMAFILVSGHGSIDIAVECVRLGAVNFLEKPFGDEVMLAALREAREELKKRLRRGQALVRATAALSSLTQRERQILTLLLEGQTNKEVALELEISPRTIEVHRAAALQKLGVKNLLEAASRFNLRAVSD